MEALFRLVSGACAALVALLCPVAPLIGAVTLFIIVDFVTGVIASRTIAQREGEEWWFESRKAWRTLFKLGFTAMAIVMTWIMECCLEGVVELHLAKFFTGFVCGVELWSFLENAANISEAPIFVWLGKIVKRRIRKEVEDE